MCASAPVPTFMSDLAGRLRNRVQLTSDGLRVYLNAVESVFGSGVDYAMLVKIYGETSEGQKRYSPAECVGIKRQTVTGDPDPKPSDASVTHPEGSHWEAHLVKSVIARATIATNTRAGRVLMRRLDCEGVVVYSSAVSPEGGKNVIHALDGGYAVGAGAMDTGTKDAGARAAIFSGLSSE